MTHPTETPIFTPFALFLPLCLASGCASPARQNEASAPNASETSDDGTSAAPGAEASDQYAAPKETAASEAMQAAPEEDFGPGAPKAAPAISEGAREKKKVDLLGELRLQVLDLGESLQPETQSCDGAKPLKDAICSIAGRICEMEAPSTAKSVDCSQAQESCEKAKKDYKAKCS